MAVTRMIVLLVAVTGALLGLAPAAVGASPPGGWLLDLLVGGAFLAGGLVGHVRRPASVTGPLLVATGFAWFLGNLAYLGTGALSGVVAEAIPLHRGVLLHAIVSFATGRLRSHAERLVVALGYIASVATLARIETVSLSVWILAVVVTARRRRSASPDQRWEATVALHSSLAVTSLLAGAFLARAAAPPPLVDPTILAAYQLLLVGAAVGLTWALVRDRSGQVADLVVELAEEATGDLRDALATALHDPTLELAYRLPEVVGYVTADGRPFTVPTPGANRAVTPIEEQGETRAVVVHDPSRLDDPRLLASLTAVVRLTSANVRLRAELRDQIAEVEASRRRLLEAGDDERRRLQRRLDAGAHAHLRRALERLRRAGGHTDDPDPTTASRGAAIGGAAGMPADGDRVALEGVDRARQQAEGALDDLDDLSQGLHPVALRAGLEGALRELADHATVPTSLHLQVGPLPDHVAATAYFVCSEALANATKHAHASAIHLAVTADTERLTVAVTDDGVGGATLTGGTGLRGLVDRVEGLGGTLTVGPSPGGGTRLVAELPLGDQPT